VNLTQGDGPPQTAVLTIDVDWPAINSVQYSGTLEPGRNIVFTATTLPVSLPANYRIKWTSDRTDIISVGIYTGEGYQHMAGTAIVTAELEYNSNPALINTWMPTGVKFDLSVTIPLVPGA